MPEYEIIRCNACGSPDVVVLYFQSVDKLACYCMKCEHIWFKLPITRSTVSRAVSFEQETEALRKKVLFELSRRRGCR